MPLWDSLILNRPKGLDILAFIEGLIAMIRHLSWHDKERGCQVWTDRPEVYPTPRTVVEVEQDIREAAERVRELESTHADS